MGLRTSQPKPFHAIREFFPPSAGPPTCEGTALQETPAPIEATGRTLGLLSCNR